MSYTYKTPKPNFIEIRQLIEYLKWHDLDCTKTAAALTRNLSAELNGAVTLRNLVMAAILSGYAVIPSSGLDRYIGFCRVSNP